MNISIPAPVHSSEKLKLSLAKFRQSVVDLAQSLTLRQLVLAGLVAFFGLLAISIGIGYVAAEHAAAKELQADTQSTALGDFQKMSASDRAIAQRIRKSIHQDRTLSAYAPNIKIISTDGKVTLTGRIRSEDEKSYLEAKAIAVAGEGNVTNRLQVATSDE